MTLTHPDSGVLFVPEGAAKVVATDASASDPDVVRPLAPGDEVTAPPEVVVIPEWVKADTPLADAYMAGYMEARRRYASQAAEVPSADYPIALPPGDPSVSFGAGVTAVATDGATVRLYLNGDVLAEKRIALGGVYEVRT